MNRKKKSTHIKRIISDIVEIKRNPIENIFIHYDEDNITEIKALIIGPKDTPYENGYYLLKLNFSEKYPYEPPKGIFETTNGSIRFNPNLYENGYICLSILGTWSGPKWSACQTLKSILLSLQTLLNEHPFRNEPSYEDLKETDERLFNYDRSIEYHNLSYAICDIIFDLKSYQCFFEIIKNHFLENLETNLNKINYLKSKYNNKYFNCYIFNSTSVKTDYDTLLNKFNLITDKLINKKKDKLKVI